MNDNLNFSREKFNEYISLFLQENAKHNLISKNDEKYLFQKHIYDSLAIKLFFKKYGIKKGSILDIGCGGGFPCLPIAIEFPEFEITGIDSIRKKIDSVNHIITGLNLTNIKTICDRVENTKSTYDIVLSRAVADLSKIAEYALPLVKPKGFFVAYKSKKAQEEIELAKSSLKKYHASIVDVINYTLPLDEVYERNLIIITK